MLQTISTPVSSVQSQSILPRRECEIRTFVYASSQAAIPSDTNAVTPVTHPKRVVCRTVKPKELMISEY